MLPKTLWTGPHGVGYNIHLKPFCSQDSHVKVPFCTYTKHLIHFDGIYFYEHVLNSPSPAFYLSSSCGSSATHTSENPKSYSRMGIKQRKTDNIQHPRSPNNHKLNQESITEWSLCTFSVFKPKALRNTIVHFKPHYFWEENNKTPLFDNCTASEKQNWKIHRGWRNARGNSGIC